MRTIIHNTIASTIVIIMLLVGDKGWVDDNSTNVIDNNYDWSGVILILYTHCIKLLN